jgi:hypothetical protein
MSSSKPIGGYFELELREGNFPHADAVLLNSARSCFEYTLRARDIKKVYLPWFTCDVMLEPLKKLGLEPKWYTVNKRLEVEPELELADDEYLVYVNYFGVKDAYVHELSDRYGDKLLLDNSQAFYSTPLATGDTFYSPRKFFGVADGGMLHTQSRLIDDLPTDTESHSRFSHLLKRIELGAEAGYDAFKRDDSSLSGAPLQRMSELTKRLLGSIDFVAIREGREANFRSLHERLGQANGLELSGDLSAPLCYPFMVEDMTLRQRLIDKKVFVPTYWPNVHEWCKPESVEYWLTDHILPLPIDQRYGEADMERIVQIIHG